MSQEQRSATQLTIELLQYGLKAPEIDNLSELRARQNTIMKSPDKGGMLDAIIGVAERADLARQSSRYKTEEVFAAVRFALYPFIHPR